jgi:hypothetical protein
MVYTYRPSVLALLLNQGIRPLPTTDPELVRAFLNSLYVFEIRELRRRRRELEEVFGAQPLGPYSRQVQDLKDRYPMLSTPLTSWLSPVG